MTNLNFPPFPILTTERLTLRPLSAEDRDTIFALRSDAEVNKYLDRAPSKTIDDAIHFINQVTDNTVENNAIYWVITLTDTQTAVGTICLFDFSEEKNCCEIGYELLTKFQRQGIMKEAAQRVIDYVFHKLKLKEIRAFTHYQNKRSTQLLLQLDFIKSLENDVENPNVNCFTLKITKNEI